jgi:hypothetical protein
VANYWVCITCGAHHDRADANCACSTSKVKSELARAAVRVRAFDTGATRSPDAHRDDPEGFLSPLVIDRFSEYMSKHRVQSDGSLRGSDNWQRGMPTDSYMKGAWRHFLHWWTRHRGWAVRDPGAAADIEEDLCALLFNVQGYLHETILARLKSDV